MMELTDTELDRLALHASVVSRDNRYNSDGISHLICELADDAITLITALKKAREEIARVRGLIDFQIEGEPYAYFTAWKERDAAIAELAPAFFAAARTAIPDLLDKRKELIKERDEAFLAGQQSLAHSLHAAERAADAWKTLAEKEKERADKFMWQVRDTCARAERAEAERDALRAQVATLTKGDKKYPSPGPSGYSPDEFEDQNTRMGISEYMDAVRSRDIKITKLEAERAIAIAERDAAVEQGWKQDAHILSLQEENRTAIVEREGVGDLRALVEKWRERAQLAALAGDEDRIPVEARDAMRGCASELEALLDAAPRTARGSCSTSMSIRSAT